MFLKPSANRRQRASLGTRIHYDSTQVNRGLEDLNSGECEDHVMSEWRSKSCKILGPIYHLRLYILHMISFLGYLERTMTPKSNAAPCEPCTVLSKCECISMDLNGDRLCPKVRHHHTCPAHYHPQNSQCDPGYHQLSGHTRAADGTCRSV